MAQQANLFTSPSELQAIAEAVYPQSGSSHSKVKVYCRNNPDGTIRWAWPSEAQQPDFLNFYHVGSFRAAAMVMFIRLLFAINLQRLFVSSSGFLVVPEGSPLAGKNWALFTGTVGPNRKAIFRLSDAEGVTFIKVPVGEQAKHQLSNEAAALKRLNLHPVCGLVVPEHKLLQNDIHQLSDINVPGAAYPKSLSDFPFATLSEWFTGSITEQNRVASAWWQRSTTYLSLLRYNNKHISKALISKLDQLAKHLGQYDTCLTAPAHGDFTPWNTRAAENQLIAWDWEMFDTSYPVFFDAFHFMYQQAVLINRHSYAQIRKTIDAFFDLPCCRSFTDKIGINLDLLEQQYLYTVITSSLQSWSKQNSWHVQTNWLMEVWNEALNDHLTLEDPSQYRQLLLRDFFSSVRMQQYAWLKSCGAQPWELHEWSDIDLCATPKTTAIIISFFKRHAFVKRVNVTRYFHRTVIAVVLANGEMLSVDCIHKFKRKALQFMNTADVLNNAETTSTGIRIASLADDLTYSWLFARLNGAALSERYRLYYFSRYAVQRQVLDKTAQELGAENFVQLLNIRQQPNPLRVIGELKSNKGLVAARNRIEYYADVLRSFFVSPGFIVTFSGVDGAGKSTVINTLRERIEKRTRRRVVVLRHRPSVLPIISAWRHGKAKAEKLATDAMPTTHAQSGKVSSLLRFTYYYADYLFGQFYVFFRYNLRGDIVIYDRYYFDFIHNPERSNIRLPQRLAKLCYKFLLKPDFNFFLYAPVEVIYARKQEMSRTAISAIMDRYLNFFRTAAVSAPRRYVPVQNLDLKQTISQIETIIFSRYEKMA
ncbi:MAG: hypothetical protein IM638_03955 [Bacteroidetes bacterium]|nr:hypothetical protein [Bacteroidota bacterium]